MHSAQKRPKYVDDLKVLTRDAVHQYYLALWLWHRLEEDGGKASEIPLRESKRGKLRCDVDHIVAVKLWEGLKSATAVSAPDDDDALAADDATTTLNSLGNCCLLEKSFNIVKSALPLREFLERVHEFQPGALHVGVWANDLDIDPMLLDPSLAGSVEDMVAVVQARELRMKANLKEYVAGTSDRVDL